MLKSYSLLVGEKKANLYDFILEIARQLAVANAIDNRTLLTAAINTTDTNMTQMPYMKNKTIIAPTQNGNSEDAEVFNIILIVIHMLFFLLAAFGNITVIVVRLKKFMQRGLSAYKQLICQLSAVDLIFATALPFDIYMRSNKKDWIRNRIVCKLLKTIQSASLTASVGILTVMAFERYQGISNPLAHRWFTKKVILLSLIKYNVSSG